MGGGKGSPKAPPPIDPGKSMGEYLFGKGFTSFEGITDPRLQERLIGAEAAYRPRYTALELADIATMARGIEAGAPNYERQRLEAELAGLRAGEAVGGIKSEEERRKALEAEFLQLAGERPKRSTNTRQRRGFGFKSPAASYDERKEAFIKSGMEDVSERATRIAQLEAQIAEMPETMEATPGLFDLLEEQSRRAGALQREQLGLQRAEDVAALQEFAPQVVEAYREADPRSAALADLAQQQAERLYGEAEGPLSPERRRLAEQAARAGSLVRGREMDQSAVAAEILGREQFKAGLRQEARQAGAGAFQQQRTLAGDLGMAILGRPSAAIGLGGQMLGQAQQGAAGPVGPQLFDPNVGINMALQQRGQDVTFQGMQAQARAAGQAGLMGAVGGIAQGIGAAGGVGAMFCWVAREVYGADSPKWVQFRNWMVNEAPSWFRFLYNKYGAGFAEFISNKPRLKSIIRKWMDTKIK